MATEGRPADNFLFLPGGDSENQYAIVVNPPAVAPSFGQFELIWSAKRLSRTKICFLSIDLSTTGYVNVQKRQNSPPSEQEVLNGPEVRKDPDVTYANTNKPRIGEKPGEANGDTGICAADEQKDRFTRSESFDYDQVVFIGDVVKREKERTSPAREDFTLKYGELELRPPSQRGIIGEKGDTVYDEVAHEVSPVATSSPLAPEATRRANPFVSPLRPFTAAEDSSASRKTPSPYPHIYKSLEGDSVDQREEYQAILQDEDSGLYESIEAPPRREKTTEQRPDLNETEEEEGIYEPIIPPKPKMQVPQSKTDVVDMERSETPVSEASSFDSDEFIEEVSVPSELTQSFTLSTLERQRHELLPHFSMMEKKQKEQEKRSKLYRIVEVKVTSS